MSQHDYVIANQTFPNFRTDLNSAFAAIVSQNSGASAPSTTYAYQLWYDTGNDILKMRNADDDAWIDLFTVDQTADTAIAPSVAAGPSLIINGAMNVDQRNETVTNGDKAAADDKFTADRFMNQFQDGDSSTRIDSSNATITDHPLGFSNASKIVCSTVDDLSDATDVYMNISYRGIEHQDLQRFQFGTSSAKNLTLSFWVKSGVTGTFFATLVQGLNAAANRVRYHASYTISSANTWEKKIISVAGPTTGLNWLSNNTSSQALQIMFHLAASSDRLDSTLNAWFEDTTNTETIRAGTGQTNFFLTADAEFYLTGVQLEEGTVANPVFQHESYAETLRKCHRYYIQGTNIGSFYPVGNGVASSGTSFRGFIPTTVEMRTVNTFGNLDTIRGAGSSETITSHNLQEVTGLGIGFNATSSGMTTARAYVITNSATDGNEFYLDGEL
jgi:hypothetical protein